MKTYASGSAAYVRPIAKPVAGTVLLAVGGDPKVEGLEFSVDAATGIVSFVVAPDIGAEITAGFEFDVPARFDSDRIETSVASFRAGSAECADRGGAGMTAGMTGRQDLLDHLGQGVTTVSAGRGG